jgi:SAM-dependent methyltransferase/uncharacterized protein YbaR (Trm112 family)
MISTTGSGEIDATSRARAFLDRRLAESLTHHLRNPAPRYGAHGQVLRTDRIHVAALARRVSLLRAIHRAGGQDFLDIGGGFGELSALVRDTLGRRVFLHDLSPAFMLFAQIWMRTRSACGDAAALPFRRGSFATVVCSEVVEHVERPVLVFLELSRVARDTIVVSTDQCCPTRWEYALRMATADRRSAHGDRNWYLPDDFRTLMGPDTALCASIALPRRTHGWRIKHLGDLADIVGVLSAEQPYSSGAGGIMAVRGSNADLLPADRELVEQVIEHDREADARFLGAARKTLDIMVGKEAPPVELPNLDLLCCPEPKCEAALRRDSTSDLICESCGSHYQTRWGVPLLHPARYTTLDDALAGIPPGRARGIRAVADGMERGGRAQWTAPFVWALLGAIGFFRLRVGLRGERARILYGWCRDALLGTGDPGAEG